MCRKSTLASLAALLVALQFFGACGGDESPTAMNEEEPVPEPDPDPPHPLVGSWRLTTNNADALVENTAQDLVDNEGVSPGEALAFVRAVDRALVEATGLSAGCVLTFNQDVSHSNYVEGSYTWCSSSSARWSHTPAARDLIVTDQDITYRFFMDATSGEVDKLLIVFGAGAVLDHVDEKYKPWFSTVIREINDLDVFVYTLGVVFTFERL
ncbi:MAG: hypothetical protein OXH02_05620 [Gemmatimonadetes bacterium]|nr:hypothetical protein [Gemmatimonadota bacterium]